MDDQHQRSGYISAEISDGAVQLLQEYTGRGPTKARTTLNHDSVLILFKDTLTKGERKLAELGRKEQVLELRHHYQQAMREDLTALVERHTRRKVVAFMSANHADPDMAAEIFALEPADSHPLNLTDS